MRLFLVILALSQFQGYEQKPANGANFSTQFRANPDVMRQMSNDQADSIKSDRINYFQDDQNPMRSQEAPYQPIPNMYQQLPGQQQLENAHSRVVSPDTAQDYTELRGGQDNPTQGGYQQSRIADSYQNYGPSSAQAAKSYQPQQTSLDMPKNYQNSEPVDPVSTSVPAVRPPAYMPAQSDYRVYNEVPQSTGQYQSGYHPQSMPQNYQAYNNDDSQNYMQPVQPNQSYYHPVNQDGGQDYTQSTWAGPQQNPQSYQLVNKNSDTGVITISLPGNEDAEQGAYNAQRQQQPQFVNGYQVINEGPVDYTVSNFSPGSTISVQSPQHIPPPLPTNYNSAANVIPQDGYMPVQNAYYPPQVAPALASGQYFGQSQNDVYAPYMGSYKPQDQQYEMWNPQQPPIPITMQMPYLDANKESQAQLMDMINSQLARHRIARMASPF